MAYNIDKTPTFTTTVEVTDPDGETSDFQATFLALDITSFGAFDLEQPAQCLAFLKKAVLGVSDVVDGLGNEIADGDALRDRLFNMPYIRVAAVRAYLEGITRASRGN